MEQEPVGRDRWMISYADFITVLFAFFVVLFASLNQDNHSIKRVSSAIHHGFVELEPFAAGANYPDRSQPQLLPDGSILRPHRQQQFVQTNASTAAAGIDIEALRRQLEAAIGTEMRDGQVTLDVTPEGFVISLKELGFFQSGQAVLQPGAAAKIEGIAKVLARHGFYLRVEGHSDDQPIHTAQFDSNWQLSTARATAVLMLLTSDSGMDPGRISLAGYGQYRPIANNKTVEGRKLNRRVDLVVVAGVDPYRKPQ